MYTHTHIHIRHSGNYWYTRVFLLLQSKDIPHFLLFTECIYEFFMGLMLKNSFL